MKTEAKLLLLADALALEVGNMGFALDKNERVRKALEAYEAARAERDA